MRYLVNSNIVLDIQQIVFIVEGVIKFVLITFSKILQQMRRWGEISSYVRDGLGEV